MSPRLPSRRTVRRVGLAILLSSAVPCGRLLAQAETGTVTGAVADESGQALAGAPVVLVNERTGESRSAVADAAGMFQFAAVAPGSYTVRVSLSGFSTFERRRLALSASDRLSLGELRLKIGALSEVLTVEARGARVNAEDSQHSGLLTATQIEQIQSKGRDVVTLLRLLPGVRYEDDVESLGESFGSQLPNMGGQRRQWNHVSVDGVIGNEIGGSNRVAQAVNLDAVDEVKVLLNTYRAEFGRGGGAYVQIVTKGGTSRYQGSAYYYGRNEALNANNFFNNLNGRPRPRYRYNTFGFRFGGPAQIPGLWEPKDHKLFFFYSLEAPITETPGAFRNFRVPTERERSGDFSQTLDTNGQLIVIRDPLTGQPFPGNVIPPERIDPSGQALLKLLPLPQRLDRAVSGGNYNFTRQETAEKPKMNNILRFDWKPSGSDTVSLSVKDWYSDQRGSEITVGPAKWGFFNAHYKSTDRTLAVGHTHIFNGGLVNEAALGIRRQTEQFNPVSEADYRRLRRSDAGFTLGQFHPELNPQGIIPKASFGLANSPDFTFDNRLLTQGRAWAQTFRDSLTWSKARHTFKAGLYLEHLFNTEGAGQDTTWMGQFAFNRDINNPLDTNFAFSNALLGVFRDYTEGNAMSRAKGHGWLAEWFLQDTWKAGRRLTVDYGVRFLWYTPWYQSDERSAAFVPERYDPARAPRLYRPALVDGRRVAQDPLTGELLPEIYVGTFVPGTGDPDNGMVREGTPGYPRGFRDQLAPHPEPRVGLAYDPFGDGRTAVHASAGLYHFSRFQHNGLTEMAGNPPLVRNSQVFYGTMATLLEIGTLADRPASTSGVERRTQTPSSYSWSLGIQRELGWGTVADVTYVGSVGRHLEQISSVNAVPDGARFLDQHPENRDPRTGAVLGADFLRPYAGYGSIDFRSYYGTSSYNALQLQVNRRYIKGLQFSVAYTLARALGIGDDDPGRIDLQRPLREWNYGPLTHSQTHSLVVNYTWNLPRASRLWSNALVRVLFDDWQLSGENALVSGDWDGVDLATSDGFNFTGGEGGVRVVMAGPLAAGERDATPGQDRRWIDVQAVRRPSGRGDHGNAARNLFRRPGVNNWNLAFFKNVPLGGRRGLQLRWEMFNVLNHTQFSAIDTTARFDPAGSQINPRFGLATSARNPRVMQGSLRLNF